MNHPSRLEEDKFKKQWREVEECLIVNAVLEPGNWKATPAKVMLRRQGKWVNRPLALPSIFSSVLNSEGYSELLV